jgi:hypothetical protein
MDWNWNRVINIVSDRQRSPGSSHRLLLHFEFSQNTIVQLTQTGQSRPLSRQLSLETKQDAYANGTNNYGQKHRIFLIIIASQKD